MAVNPSIQLGTSGNWAIKEDNLLAYKQLGNKFFDREFDFSRGTRATFVGRNGLIQESGLTSAELVTNGDFATDSDWAKGAGWSISNGAASCDGTQTSNSQLRSAFFDFSVDTTVTLSFDVINYSAGDLDAGVTGTGQADLTGINANGTYSVTVVSSAGSRQVDIVAKSDFIGSIDNVSVKEIQLDVPRIDFTDDPTGHLLLEPQSTNLITSSEDFSSWSIDDVTIQSDSSTSPDGNTKATLIKGNTNSSRHHIRKTLSGTVDASYSIFAKAKELRYLQIASINTTNQYVNFDLQDGLVGTVGSDFSNAKIEKFGSGWYRLSVTSDSRYNSFYISLVSGTNANWLESWVMSNNTDGMYIWGSQLEQLSYATSYIPTSGSTATRLGETANNAGGAGVFNSEEGVLYLEVSRFANDILNTAISINQNGDFTNSVSIKFRSTENLIFGIIYSSGNISTLMQYTLPDDTQFNKIAISYAENNFSLWVNGIKVLTDTSGNAPIGLNNLSFNLGTELFYGKTKNLQVFNHALTDEELQTLTT